MGKVERGLYYSIKAMTPLHVGVGAGLGHIDLPIQREVHTKFPMIPGTAVKGALREYKLRAIAEDIKDSITNEQIRKTLMKILDDCLASCGEGEKCPEIKINDISLKEKLKNGLVNLFGCRDQAGNLAFSDLRILLFPVKSLNGIFAYITSPAVLMRLAEDVQMENPSSYLKVNVKGDKRRLGDDEAFVAFNHSVNLMDKDLVVLEEFTFKAVDLDLNNELINWLMEAFDKLGINFDEIIKRLVILSDNAFNDFVQNYTEVQTHVKIDPSTGTVQSGALWTEEYLPAETFMYGIIFEVRNNKSEDTDLTKDLLPDYLHLGGDITTGKGFVRIYRGKEG